MNLTFEIPDYALERDHTRLCPRDGTGLFVWLPLQYLLTHPIPELLRWCIANRKVRDGNAHPGEETALPDKCELEGQIVFLAYPTINLKFIKMVSAGERDYSNE